MLTTQADLGCQPGARTATPGRSSKPVRSVVTTVRAAASAVAAMIRSWALRRRPARRTAASSAVWARATSRSYAMTGSASSRSSTKAWRFSFRRPVASATPTPSSAAVIAAIAGSSSAAINQSRSNFRRSTAIRMLVSSNRAVRTAPRRRAATEALTPHRSRRHRRDVA